MLNPGLVPRPESKRRYEEGWRCYNRGDFIRAERHFRRGLKLARRLEDPLGEAHLLNGSAIVALEQGRHADALEISQVALALFESCGDRRHSAMVLGTIGNVYLYQRRFEEAEHRQRQALALNLEVKSFYNAGVCAHNVGLCLLERAELDAAQAMFLQAQLYYPKIKATHTPSQLSALQVAVDHSLSQIYFRRGEVVRAQRTCRKALKLCRQVEERLTEAECLITLGKYGRKRRRQFLEEALKLSRDIGTKELLTRAHKELAELHREAGRWKLALEHLEACYQEERLLFNPEINQRIEQVRRNELLNALESAKRLREEAERAAYQDSLTGLFNRRYIDQQLQLLFTEAQQRGTRLAVALFDIDNFKRINDQLSHAIGDEVLRRVAQILSQGVRPQDLVGRYGGEEFVLVFSGVSLRESVRLCDRLRQSVAQEDWCELRCGMVVTLSGGICVDTSLSNSEKLLQEADRLLYLAKGRGKNRIISSLNEVERPGKHRQSLVVADRWGSGGSR